MCFIVYNIYSWSGQVIKQITTVFLGFFVWTACGEYSSGGYTWPQAWWLEFVPAQDQSTKQQSWTPATKIQTHLSCRTNHWTNSGYSKNLVLTIDRNQGELWWIHQTNVRWLGEVILITIKCGDGAIRLYFTQIASAKQTVCDGKWWFIDIYSRLFTH